MEMQSDVAKSQCRDSEYSPGYIVYVGGLGNSGSKAEIEDTFSRYGLLRSVWLSEHPPRYAFVEFEKSRDAREAITHVDGKMLCGRIVHVAQAKYWDPATPRLPDETESSAEESDNLPGSTCSSTASDCNNLEAADSDVEGETQEMMEVGTEYIGNGRLTPILLNIMNKIIQALKEGQVSKAGISGNLINLITAQAREAIKVCDKYEKDYNFQSTTRDFNEVKKEVQVVNNKCDKITDSEELKPPSSIRDKTAEKVDPQIVIEFMRQEDTNKAWEKIKAKVKSEQIPIPIDVIPPKNKRIILKTNSITEAKIIGQKVLEDSEIGDIKNIRVSNFRTHRMIICGLPETISDENIKKEISRAQGLSQCHIDVVKTFSSQMGSVNAIIDVDAQTRHFFRFRPRFCIDFVRVRVAPFVRCLRCWKCQKLGHTMYQCTNPLRCPRCGNPHSLAECNSEKQICVNCPASCHNHAANDRQCPSFVNFKKEAIRKATRLFSSLLDPLF